MQPIDQGFNRTNIVCPLKLHKLAIKNKNLASLLIFFFGCLLTSVAGPSYAHQEFNFVEIIQRSLSSVVTIEVKKRKKKYDRTLQEIPKDAELNGFFNNFFLNRGILSTRATGAGIVFSTDGHIVTAAHLVKDSTKIKVKFSGSDKKKATLVGLDMNSDVALLKVNRTDLSTPVFGNTSSINLGTPVVSIGAPFGLEKSVSQGIVSGLNRRISSTNQIGFIQTDVSTNPGYSGGPVFNSSGELVAMNSHILSNNGKFQGVSFAVPIEEIQKSIEIILDDRHEETKRIDNLNQ